MLCTFQFHKGTIRTCCLTRVSSRISYFNSIKVQLEPISTNNDQASISNFNSIKGQLEQISSKKFSLIVRDFNSIKVQLEHSSIITIVYDMLEFQFHKDTIRTFVSCHNIQELGNFNSIKVQLEPTNFQCSLNTILHFNSIKVQLELVGACSPPFRTEFQFHKGTIRTR